MFGRRDAAIKEVREQLQMKQDFVAQSAELSAALLATEQELGKAETVTARWEKSAPGRRDIPSLYGKIDDLAKDAQLAISRFDPQPFVVREKVQEIPITMNCTGKFAQIHQFLRGIEGLSATIWVESMRIEKSAANNKDTQCELNLVVFSNNSQSSDYAKHGD